MRMALEWWRQNESTEPKDHRSDMADDYELLGRISTAAWFDYAFIMTQQLYWNLRGSVLSFRLQIDGDTLGDIAAGDWAVHHHRFRDDACRFECGGSDFQ